MANAQLHLLKSQAQDPNDHECATGSGKPILPAERPFCRRKAALASRTSAGIAA